MSCGRPCRWANTGPPRSPCGRASAGSAPWAPTERRVVRAPRRSALSPASAPFGHGPLVDLVPQSAEDLDLDQVLGPPSGPLHADQVVDRSDPHREPHPEAHLVGGPFELLVAAGDPARMAEDVELAGVGVEREAVPHLERPGVKEERNVLRRSTEGRVELPQGPGHPLEVVPISRVADIDVVRDGRGSAKSPAQPADHHEPNPVPRQGLECVEELIPFGHVRPVRSRSRARPRASCSAPSTRCRGDRARCSAYPVRSTPWPGRGTGSRPSPAAARRRSSVSTRGITAPVSIRPTTDWATTARAGSSRWVSPARRRAWRSTLAASISTHDSRNVITLARRLGGAPHWRPPWGSGTCWGPRGSPWSGPPPATRSPA